MTTNMRLNARTTVSVVTICFNIIRMALLYIIFTFTIILPVPSFHLATM